MAGISSPPRGTNWTGLLIKDRVLHSSGAGARKTDHYDGASGSSMVDAVVLVDTMDRQAFSIQQDASHPHEPPKPFPFHFALVAFLDPSQTLFETKGEVF